MEAYRTRTGAPARRGNRVTRKEIVGSIQYELIEPLEGPTIYHTFREVRGNGLRHLGWYVDDIHAEIARMAALGYPLPQSGRGFGVGGDGGYADFECETAFGCIGEAITPPRQMPEPEYTFPRVP